MHETLAHLFDQTALRLGEKKAILFLRKGRLESQMTYSSLQQISNRVANGLKERGLRKGERVILFMPKSIEQMLFHLGVQKVGAISVILNPGFKKDEMGYFLRDTDAKIIIVGRKEEALIQSLDKERQMISVATENPFEEDELFPESSTKFSLERGNPNDPAIFIYTSGTTGQPKGAILTQQNLSQDAKNIIRIWEITEKDVLCHALPLFHVHGLCFALHTSLIAGAKIVMCDEFSTETVMDILSSQEGELACTIFMAVPTMYLRMIDKMEGERQDFSHLRLLASGSAPLPPKDFERIKKVFGKEPVEREGMSETGMNFSNPLRNVKKPGSIGLPLPHVEVRIVSPNNFEDLKPGEVGEIWLKGPNVTPGYWRKPRETEAAFVDGWFRTGDLGKKDEDGYYYITDRLKHIIISGGENISPKEIESVINQHPKVSESCVVGIPDERWGEKVVAAVVIKPGVMLATKEIQDHCKQHLLDWKCPKEVFFLGELPRNKMGKILKEEIVKYFHNLSSPHKEG
ncbi:MAG: class I adenylate-forming enzyme family protein [Deltaproteobacteria bacterium]|nr:class I adenylate-forming enzyme family protein [Deltaproteobacteria bacterium]